jgi:hypothetical protein
VVVLPGGTFSTIATTPLLDGAVFQNLFRSSIVTLPPGVSHSGSAPAQSEQGSPGGQAPAGTESAPQDAGPQGATRQAPVPMNIPLALLDDLGRMANAASRKPAEVSQQAVRDEEPARDGASIAAGAAGLVAAHGLPTGRRQLLDREAMAGAGASNTKPLARKALDAITGKWFGKAASSQHAAERRDLAEPEVRRGRRSRIEW